MDLFGFQNFFFEQVVLDWLTNFFGKFWQKLLDWLWWLLDSLLLPLKWLADGLIFVLNAACFLVFDGFLTLVEGFFNALDTAALGTLDFLGANAHPVFIWFIQQLCIVQGMELIFTALLIRFTLNLIPGTITRI
jgi:hypothetical protein